MVPALPVVRTKLNKAGYQTSNTFCNRTLAWYLGFYSSGLLPNDRCFAPSTTLVRIQPPKVHATAYTTGGLRTLYKKISLSKNRKIRNDHEFGAYTDNSGCFVPEESSKSRSPLSV
ncbi:Hypp2312 [Branchiostoma lanceolatum]|uniref:Hypp2312 protein n=1 Tax=Branchiostoma lanceolatum TaxID=7740 RepID=A0A8K0EMB7_BRALA|nr:Hypp2312 [Branchiostoma lanceolatum]